MNASNPRTSAIACRGGVKVYRGVVGRKRDLEASRAAWTVVRQHGDGDIESTSVQVCGAKREQVGQWVAHARAVHAHDPGGAYRLAEHPCVDDVVVGVALEASRAGYLRVGTVRARVRRVPEPRTPDAPHPDLHHRCWWRVVKYCRGGEHAVEIEVCDKLGRILERRRQSFVAGRRPQLTERGEE